MNDIEDAWVTCLEDSICHTGTDRVLCEFCGKTHGVEGQFDEHVSCGYLNGKQYVWGCRCDGFMQFARFLLTHRLIIIDALLAYSKALNTMAEDLSVLKGGTHEEAEA